MALRPNEHRPSEDKPVRRSFDRKVSRARSVMMLEKIWPRLWLPVAMIILFILVSTFGLWPTLPISLHILFLSLFALALAASFVPVFRIKSADRHGAIRWLEKKSGLPHRPATVLDDNLSDASDEPSNALWRAHKKQANAHVQAMKTGLPQPRTAKFDPYALRVPLVLALAVTLGLHADRIQAGVMEAFDFTKSGAISNLRIDAWITPPAYTGIPPVMLVNGAKPVNHQTNDDDTQPKPIKIPENSELVVRVSGPSASSTNLVFRLPADQKGDTNSSTLPKIESKQDGAVRDLRSKLTKTLHAALHLDGRHIKNWQFVITPDHPPAITFTKPPQASARGVLRLSYRVADDYGVIQATAHISKPVHITNNKGEHKTIAQPSSSPAPDNLMVPLGTPPTFPLLLPEANTKRGTATTYKELTAHPWAGLNVEMVLIAKDEAEKTGKSLVTRFTLPQRNFTKPLARAIIKERRHLVERPFQRRIVARSLDLITNVPLRTPSKVIKNISVFLGLRSAYWRLLHANKREDIRSVVDQLWDIALIIEDGNLSKAERKLRSAQDKLMDALSNNASPKEIARLMKELRQALNKFLNAMAKEQQKQPQNADQPQPPGDQQTLTSRELDKMLRDIENMAKTGSRDAAKQMLSQLREMLENLNNGQQKPSARSQKMRKQLDELGKMIMQQRRLLDETHQQNQQRRGKRAGDRQGQQRGERQSGQRQGRQQQGQRPGQRQGQQQGKGQRQGRQGQGQQGQKGQGAGNQMSRAGARGLQQRQGQLLDGLNELMDQMGRMGTRIPQDLMRAGSNMGQAESQLGRQRLNSAGRQQGQALENMRKGATELVEQMRRNNQGKGRRSGRQGRDPLGRPQNPNGPQTDSHVKIPDKIDTRRARDILEDLRQRLGQSTRPPKELDYLERLIEPF